METTTENETPCSICQTTDPPNWHTLDCSHKFHTECIIQWFRRGGNTCPICRAEGNTGQGLRFLDRLARASFLRQASRRKDAPKELKRLVQRLQKAEKMSREMAKDFSKYRKKHKKVMQTISKKRQKSWRSHNRVWRIRNLLAIFTHPDCPVPLLVASNRHFRRHRRRS